MPESSTRFVVISEDILPGRSIEAITAASVSAACRCTALPRTLPVVGDVAKVAAERVEHAYGVRNRELGLPAMPTPPAAYVPPFASTLGLSAGTRHRAEALAAKASDPIIATTAIPRAAVPGKHFHEPPAAGQDAVPSCVEVEVVPLVPLAVFQLWRDAVESGELDRLQQSNPP